MDQKNNHHGGNGFFAGVIVGVLITLLFTTKKGRELFKETVDRTIDKFNTLQDKIDTEEVVTEEDDVEGNDYVKPEPTAPKEPVKEVRYLAQEPKKEPVKKAVKPEPEVEIEEEEDASELKEVVLDEKSEPEPAFAIPDEEPEDEPEPPEKSSGVRKFFKLKKS